MNEAAPTKKDKVHSTKGHLLYSLGAVPSALPYNMIGSFFIYFYSIIVGLPLQYVGVIWILYGIWNAIDDPLLAYFMDKHKTKWGRRVPYIVVGTIPLTIGFIFLWFVPWTETLYIFVYAIAMLFVFDFGFTLVMTAWAALYTEMYETEKERASTVAIKDFIAFIASMIGIMFPPLIAAAVGWTLAGFFLGITIPITMYLSLLGIKERKEYQIDEPLPLIPAFKETFKNKSFVIIALTYTMIDFSFSVTLLALPFYSRFILNLDEAWIGFAAIGVVIGILVSVPFWWKVYAKKGAKYGLLLSLIIFSAGIWPIFLINNFYTLIGFTILPGFGAGGMLMTEPSISAAIDYDELQTGKRREATYNGILTLIARLSIVFSGLTLILIQSFFGFNSEAIVQTPLARSGLRILVAIVPLLGILVALFIFKFFPINYKYFKEMQEKLKILHEKRLSEAIKKSLMSKP